MATLANGLSGAMNARTVGTGETTLVLAHGYGSNQSVWDKVIPDLRRRYRVVTFDWSFTSSVDSYSIAAFDAKRHTTYEAFSDDLIALADEMNIRDAVYLGHSMSGMIGCIASVKRPEIFRHLMLLGASPRYLNSEEFGGGFDKEDTENIFSNIEFNFQQWSTNFASLVVSMHDSTSTEKFRNMLQSMRPEVALSLAKTVFLGDQREILEKVEVACSIIQCTNDIVVPMPVAEYMEKNIKGKASLEVIEAHGHFPQLTVPNKLIEVVDRVFLGSGLSAVKVHDKPLGPDQPDAMETGVEPAMEA